MQAIKRITALFIVLAAIFAARASIGAELVQGGTSLGSVSLQERGGARYAAVDEIFSALGIAASFSDGGISGSASGQRIEFWDGSSVARVNGLVAPLLANVFQEGGHWWCEAGSLMTAFSRFVQGAGMGGALELRGAPTVSAAAPAAPVAPAAQQPALPQPVQVSTPAQIKVAPYVAPAPSASDGGIVMMSKVRWGEQPDAYRAVVDLSMQVDAKVEQRQGEVEVSFPNTMSPTMSCAAPWEGYAVSSRQASSTVVLTFKHRSSSVKTFWLTEPARFVIDFAAPDQKQSQQPAAPPPVQIQADPTPASPPAVQPAPVKPTPVKPAPASHSRPLVVVDAGHGGHDPGALGNKLREKDINLKAALEMAQILKAHGMDVVLTRNDDRYLKLGERTEFANTRNADIFISLHCNALPKGRHASGIELYLMAESTDRDALNLAVIENREISGSAQSAEEVNAAADKRTQLLLKILGDMQQNDKITESTSLAEQIYNRMKGAGLSVRTVRQAPFFVLRGAGMPAILVEMGFITEKSDAADLNSQAHRKKLLEAAAQGISNYLKTNRIGG